MGKTIGLLNLYLWPPLLGYPPYNDFPALYHASSKLSQLIVRDVHAAMPVAMPVAGMFVPVSTAVTKGPAYHIDDHMAVQVFTTKIPPYLSTIGILLNEFGNITSPDIHVASNLSVDGNSNLLLT